MNKVILMGRLTRDPNVRYSPRNNSQEEMAIARYTLAVDRRGAKDGQQSADFISKLRAAGKTEKEVSEIIEQAAEAATVLKKTESPEHPEKIKAAGGENLQDALLKVGISAKEALTAFESIYRLRRQEKSNNWRKYHGLPLKRSKGGKRRGDRKRNDSNSENTGIS